MRVAVALTPLHTYICKIGPGRDPDGTFSIGFNHTPALCSVALASCLT